jgi:tripartite-type tricarboxylate transporter receptor subunit TctC
MAPAGTPREVIAKFNAEVQKVVANPDVKERLLAQGAIAQSGTPEQMGQQIKSDVAKWGKVVRTAGVKIEN